MKTLNKPIVVLTLFLLLLTNPSSALLMAHHDGRRQATCKEAAESWELLFAVTAFGFAVTPGMQGFALVWGGLALGAKAYATVGCGDQRAAR